MTKKFQKWKFLSDQILFLEIPLYRLDFLENDSDEEGQNY